MVPSEDKTQCVCGKGMTLDKDVDGNVVGCKKGKHPNSNTLTRRDIKLVLEFGCNFRFLKPWNFGLCTMKQPECLDTITIVISILNPSKPL